MADAVSPTSEPSAEQRLLLQAALRHDDVARAAARAWSERVALDDVDYGSQRMIPLLARNLERLGVAHAEAGRMRGIHRYWWSQNQLRLRTLRRVLDVLGGAGIPVLALKGVPLALGYHDDVGLRPMNDVDVLVPTRCADAASAALGAAGFRMKAWLDLLRDDGTIATGRHPGVPLVDDRGEECDLHWHVLHDCLWSGADDEVWAEAEELEHRGLRVRVPSPTDLLLHACVHGAAWNAVPTFRWVADAAALIERAGERIDWQRLLVTARRRMLALVLHRAVEFLHEVVDVSVPATFRAELAGSRFTAAERREYALRIRDDDYVHTPTGRWCQLARRCPDSGALARALRLPGFLREAWSADHWWQLPGRLFGHALPGYAQKRAARRRPRPAEEPDAR